MSKYNHSPYALLPNFVSDLLSIYKIYNSDRINFKKMIDKRGLATNSKNLKDKNKEINLENLHWMLQNVKNMDIKNAAYFSYAYSLFEKNLNDILQYVIRNDTKIKDRYFKKWNTFIDSGSQNKYENISSDILRDNEAQFQNYEILIRNEKSSYENFLSSIQGIKFPTSKMFHSERSNFTIFREVRNLIVHRGDEIDVNLINSLKRNSYLKKNPELLEKFFDEQINFFNTRNKRLNIEEEISSPEDLIGKKIYIDLNSVINNLIFMMSWFTMQTPIIKRHIDIDSANHMFGEIYHNMLEANIEIAEPRINRNISRIFRVKSKYVHDYKINEISDMEKFNFLLSQNQEYQLLKNIYIKEKDFLAEAKEFHNENIEKYFKFSDLDGDLEMLLKFYIKNKKKDFLNLLKSMEFNKRELDEWYIFKKWSNELEFKKYYNNIKNI